MLWVGQIVANVVCIWYEQFLLRPLLILYIQLLLLKKIQWIFFGLWYDSTCKEEAKSSSGFLKIFTKYLINNNKALEFLNRFILWVSIEVSNKALFVKNAKVWSSLKIPKNVFNNQPIGVLKFRHKPAYKVEWIWYIRMYIYKVEELINYMTIYRLIKFGSIRINNK